MRQKITREILILLDVAFLVVMLVLPLATVLAYALHQGWKTFSTAVTDVYTVRVLQLTLPTTGITVVVNTTSGLSATWTINKFYFRSKQVLVTLVDTPFSTSPVITDLAFILVFGQVGWANLLLETMDFRIVLAVSGIVLATTFVTFPFVSCELIPAIQVQDSEKEEAATLMRAGGFTIFYRITFPHIKWVLLYSVTLHITRSLGELGAVSMVSGHLRDKASVFPLHVEILLNGLHLTAISVISSISVLIAIVILTLHNIMEHHVKRGER